MGTARDRRTRSLRGNRRCRRWFGVDPAADAVEARVSRGARTRLASTRPHRRGGSRRPPRRGRGRTARPGPGSSVAQRARADITLAAGDPVTAAKLALASAAAAERVGATIEAGRSRTLAARALVAAGEHARGTHEFTRAAAELDACGALSYRDEAERELRRLGKRFRRNPPRRRQTATHGPVDAARARGRRPRHSGKDQPRDRRPALPQREDHPHPPAARLPEARCPSRTALTRQLLLREPRYPRTRAIPPGCQRS